MASFMERQALSSADATLFWDPGLGTPSLDEAWLAGLRADVAHAGLALGTSGAPIASDFATATWMWNVDPSPEIVATSWRLSLRACLIRRDVLRQLGGIHPGFRSLDAAALELGHRYLTRGAFVQHEPRLVAGARLAGARLQPVQLSLHDELLFAQLRFGPFWARWALGRGLITRAYRASDLPDAIKALTVKVPAARTFVRTERRVSLSLDAQVSVILPTIERYPYLRALLPQLAAQTYPVHEIIIVDQTPAKARDRTLATDFPALPIRIIYQDTPGQCTARNEALRIATGDHALFIDDDDEVEPDLVERHLTTMAIYDVDVCCGVAEEDGAGPIPEYQQFLRASDVFPTNNSMIRRRVLAATGMFDLAYDRKVCEDRDLGMRLYLAGTLMILDSRISVLHHHAPRGGLRKHGARAVTYASSRTRLTHRNLPHISEIYLGLRYFSERQVREMIVLRTLGTMRSKGVPLHQMMKLAYGLGVMGDSRRKVEAAEQAARELLRSYPQIDQLPA
ncbi:MAG: glycosyltransferase family A protein [Kofleriaceae bacterium]|nr:glycosyltransferase family A protein [Kofleriaceae bacterium]